MIRRWWWRGFVLRMALLKIYGSRVVNDASPQNWGHISIHYGHISKTNLVICFPFLHIFFRKSISVDVSSYVISNHGHKLKWHHQILLVWIWGYDIPISSYPHILISSNLVLYSKNMCNYCFCNKLIESDWIMWKIVLEQCVGINYHPIDIRAHRSDILVRCAVILQRSYRCNT